MKEAEGLSEDLTEKKKKIGELKRDDIVESCTDWEMSPGDRIWDSVV